MAMRRLVLLAAIAIVACDHPPTREIAAAEQQVMRAQADGAEVYAPERWKEASTALGHAHARLRERDYQGALSAANDAGESARLAIESIGPAKEKARNETTLGLAEVRSALDRVTEERAAAIKAGVAARTLAPLDARMKTAGVRVAGAGNQLEAGNYGYVADMVALLRTEVTPLPDLYRSTRTAQESKKPRTRPAGRRRPSP